MFIVGLRLRIFVDVSSNYKFKSMSDFRILGGFLDKEHAHMHEKTITSCLVLVLILELGN